MNCFSVFDHFVGRRLKDWYYIIVYLKSSSFFATDYFVSSIKCVLMCVVSSIKFCEWLERFNRIQRLKEDIWDNNYMPQL